MPDSQAPSHEGMSRNELVMKVAAKTTSSDLVDNTEYYFSSAVKTELDLRADGCHLFQQFPRENNDTSLFDIAFKNNKHNDFIVVWPHPESEAAVLLTFKPHDHYPSNYNEPWVAGISLAMCRHGYAIVVRQEGGVAKVTRPYENRAYLLMQQGGTLSLPTERKTAEESAITTARQTVDLIWAEITELFNAHFAQMMTTKPYVRSEWSESIRDRWEILGFMPLADGPPSPLALSTACQGHSYSIAIPIGLRWVLAREKDSDSRGVLTSIALWDEKHHSVLCYPNQDRRAGQGFWVITRGEDERMEERRLFVTLRGDVVRQEPTLQLDLETLNEQRALDGEAALENYDQMAEEVEQSDLTTAGTGEDNATA